MAGAKLPSPAPRSPPPPYTARRERTQGGVPSKVRGPQDAYTGGVGSSGVYQVDRDTIFRVTETVEGGLQVEILKDGAWIRGRIGMVGLRLNPDTTKLTAAAIRALPA
jgi:hypothetical protein